MNDHEKATQELVIMVENRLIIQIHRLACVQQKLTKALVHGWIGSEVVGAYMDMRNIATQIELLAKDYPQ